MNHADLPAVARTSEEFMAEVFPDNPQPSTPLGAALLWWKALIDLDTYRTALHALTFAPEQWGDYSEARKILDNLSLCSNVHPVPGVEQVLASVKFIPTAGPDVVEIVEEAPLNDVVLLTLVLCDDGNWRAIHLAKHQVPTFDQVIAVLEGRASPCPATEQ